MTGTRIRACAAIPSVVPTPSHIAWVASIRPSSAAVPKMRMNDTYVAMATRLLKIGANMGMPNRPREFRTWLSMAYSPKKKICGRQ